MIDFPIDELLDEQASLAWLERHLHPHGFHCPRCGATERRLAKRAGAIPAYRCRLCDRYHTILTGTVLAKTHQPPAKLILLLRGIAKGESTARLARELQLSRKQAHTLRQRVQENLYETLPTAKMDGVEKLNGVANVVAEAVFEADELFQNAGGKRCGASRSAGCTAPAR